MDRNIRNRIRFWSEECLNRDVSLDHSVDESDRETCNSLFIYL